MRIFSRLSLCKPLTLVLLVMLPFTVSCQEEYTGQYFSFPPGSKPHENDWQYTAMVRVTSDQTPITKKSKKNVKIIIYDKNKINFLSENFYFDSASVRANVVWNKFDEFNIELVEVGNKYAEDAYNRELVKFGPKKLISLTYKYNQEEGKFKKVP